MAEHIDLPEGWTAYAAYEGYSATHRDYDASYEGPEDGWVDNGLTVWAWSKEDLPGLIADLEAEHPHFQDQSA